MSGKQTPERVALDGQDEALLRSLAARVVGYRMEVPALLFLESVRPLNFIGSQVLVFFEPMVQTLFNWSQYDRFTRLMSERQNLDRLSRMIDDEADERDRQEKAARRSGSRPGEESDRKP